jgi:hypothetical protein
MYLTVYLVMSLPKLLYIHRIYMVVANPNYQDQACICTRMCVCLHAHTLTLVGMRMYLHACEDRRH